MKNIVDLALSHRTIREFKDVKIEDDIINKLMEVAIHTASSNGLQLSSIIRITDQKIKEELSKIGNQPYVARAPEIWIFIVDLYRNYNVAKEIGLENDLMLNFDSFIQGFSDSMIAAQNVVVTAEALGLGTNYYGNIHNDDARIIELLNLPKYTFPAVGLGFGYPNQDPQLKPRLPKDLKVFENSYEKFDSYVDSLKDYDDEMENYYDLRNNGKKSESFTFQIPKKQGSAIFNRPKMFETAKKQGFLFDNKLVEE